MPLPSDNQRPPGFLVALWFSFIDFLSDLFRKSPPTALPNPVTAKPAPVSPTTTRSISPRRTVLHPPFLNISLSGLFATPDIELTPPPRSPTPSFTLHPTPSSAATVQLDRSPTTMSDGSLEVISLGDRPCSPGRLPSPWSPTGKTTSPDVWMSTDGMLTNATGPLTSPQGDSATLLPSLTMSRISLCSSPSALDALGISVFVNLQDHLSSQGNDDDTPIHDELAIRDPQTPRKWRETFSVTKSHTPSHTSSWATEYLATPLTKLDNVDVSHVRSTSSISSMAYELRLGLFAEGKSITAIENILSLLDQASPESTPPSNDSMQPAEIV